MLKKRERGGSVPAGWSVSPLNSDRLLVVGPAAYGRRVQCQAPSRHATCRPLGSRAECSQHTSTAVQSVDAL